jgi:hypothetical protein
MNPQRKLGMLLSLRSPDRGVMEEPVLYLGLVRLV